MKRLKRVLRHRWFAGLISGLLAYGAVCLWTGPIFEMAGRSVPASIAAILGLLATLFLLIFGGPRLHSRLVYGCWPPTVRQIKAARRRLQQLEDAWQAERRN